MGGGPPFGGGPPPGGGFGAPPFGGPPGMGVPGGMGGAPPPKKGVSPAVIALIVIAVLIVFMGVGCGACMWLGARSSPSSSTPTGETKSPSSDNGSVATADDWITSERPHVKFEAPVGWTKDLRGDWGVFKSPDGNAVFAFTTFNHPGESTVRLGAAASVLGVTGVDWKSPVHGTIGHDNFAARMAEGTCNFHGPGGYMWYATVDSGTSDQMLLIYTVSSNGTKADKDAVAASIHSLQKR